MMPKIRIFHTDCEMGLDHAMHVVALTGQCQTVFSSQVNEHECCTAQLVMNASYTHRQITNQADLSARRMSYRTIAHEPTSQADLFPALHKVSLRKRRFRTISSRSKLEMMITQQYLPLQTLRADFSGHATSYDQHSRYLTRAVVSILCWLACTTLHLAQCSSPSRPYSTGKLYTSSCSAS